MGCRDIFLKKLTKEYSLERLLLFVRSACETHKEKIFNSDLAEYSHMSGVALFTVRYVDSTHESFNVEQVYDSVNIGKGAFEELLIKRALF